MHQYEAYDITHHHRHHHCRRRRYCRLQEDNYVYFNTNKDNLFLLHLQQQLHMLSLPTYIHTYIHTYIFVFFNKNIIQNGCLFHCQKK